MVAPRAGAGISYTLNADGTTLVPSFVDGDGVKLDADGMPENAMFYLDIRNGKAYFRGNIYAENGYFAGVVKATDFLTQGGESMLTGGKFNSKYLDLGKIQIDGETGDITMTGDINMGSASRIDLGSIVIDGANRTIRFTGKAGSILWGESAPVKYQFGASAAGPWHDTMEAGDKYRRDSLDGGASWGEPYQFRGTDGRNGSPGRDGTVDYSEVNRILKETYGITTTYITEGTIGSPVIRGAEIYGCNIYAGDGQGMVASMMGDGFYIHDADISAPKISMESIQNGSINRIVLGAGSRGDGSGVNRGYIVETQHGLAISYYDSNGQRSGFEFLSDGEIKVDGHLDVTAVAVFG